MRKNHALLNIATMTTASTSTITTCSFTSSSRLLSSSSSSYILRGGKQTLPSPLIGKRLSKK
ncbi:hypothetical protein E2C01_087939 [Portunus trituberculatus]|uniref:Uncharacterized protein n=1 Tax=Portunus trituberculatus TaxID=210409 RepID=A0A5B7JD60_PORTR|nr:hypothetical protein [Portunus trituberculatus]